MAQGPYVKQLKASTLCDVVDPWLPVLQKVKGPVACDGIERITTRELFDTLEVPLRHRARKTVRLSRVMRELGWTNVRVKALTLGGYLDRLRGFSRPATFSVKRIR